MVQTIQQKRAAFALQEIEEAVRTFNTKENKKELKESNYSVQYCTTLLMS